MIGSVSISVHQHCTNAEKIDRSRSLGRLRGSLTTKIHALVNALGPAKMKAAS